MEAILFSTLTQNKTFHVHFPSVNQSRIQVLDDVRKNALDAFYLVFYFADPLRDGLFKHNDMFELAKELDDSIKEIQVNSRLHGLIQFKGKTNSLFFKCSLFRPVRLNLAIEVEVQRWEKNPDQVTWVNIFA